MKTNWAEMVACPTCGANQGKPCVNEDGSVMGDLRVHARRRRRYRQVHGR